MPEDEPHYLFHWESEIGYTHLHRPHIRQPPSYHAFFDGAKKLIHNRTLCGLQINFLARQMKHPCQLDYLNRH
ncbi:protein of unknown function [Cupriavidus taiwanensis]|nr:protein of unknown function [Cupriavidus taiwanensis]